MQSPFFYEKKMEKKLGKCDLLFWRMSQKETVNQPPILHPMTQIPSMKKAQWILYDQCNIRYIEPDVTDIFFILFRGSRIASPMWDLKFNTRSLIAEYAIARSFLSDAESAWYQTHWIEAESYQAGILRFAQETGIMDIVSMRSSEEYLARKIDRYRVPWVSIQIFSNRQFLITSEEFRLQFEKPPVLETFYRYMRKTRNILIETDGKPTGWKWNYDAENRSFDKVHIDSWDWQPSDTMYIDEAKKYYHVPDIAFSLPVTRSDALSLLQYFIEQHYPDFGRLEDAMYQEDMRVHHSMLSTAINFGILHPSEVIEMALWRSEAPLSSIEGFIRQILGWREYMRQFYLSYYDDIYCHNTLDHHTKLPDSWWSYAGEENRGDITGMNCIDTVIKRVQSENYSHHIERLMVIGNYTLLMGYNPLEVNKWFAEMYTDAFEWVVTPNVMAMSQYSDGGRLATKPYISGGNYIEKMSDYCKWCQYSVRDKTCPMTPLYWDFVDRNKSIFQKWRTPYILSALAKIDIEQIREAKKQFIKTLS
jgi:deoxyribodipyrimidine photolyase-related protein